MSEDNIGGALSTHKIILDGAARIFLHHSGLLPSGLRSFQGLLGLACFSFCLFLIWELDSAKTVRDTESKDLPR